MTKEIIESRIIRHREIAGDIFQLELQWDGAEMEGSPGQFVNLYLRDRSLLLPRPISICRMEEKMITLVYRIVGKGTKELSGYQEGDSLRISTPLGHGYDLDAVFRVIAQTGSAQETDRLRQECGGPQQPGRQRTICLVAGGLGVPPMVALAKALREGILAGRGREHDGEHQSGRGEIKLVAMLGFQEEPFLTEELGAYCDEVHIASERGATDFRGNVLELMEKRGDWGDYYLSCGPKPMLKALSELCFRRNTPVQVSLEERMGCGYGACVGCTCKTVETGGSGKSPKLKKVCKDGPVFLGSEVVWDE